MGYNIGVSSEQIPNNIDCHVFIDRAFYNFVASGEAYGDNSILIRSGQYYNLNLKPLLKLVYTWDEVTKEYISDNIQNIDTLIELTVAFRDSIQNDSSVCEKIEYTCYDPPVITTENDIKTMIKQMDQEMAKTFLDSVERQKKKTEENLNPWKSYFEGGQILEDLTNLIKSINCYKNKGATEVYLTAG